MWTTYSYVCTNCDTLIEVTTMYQYPEDPYCICSESDMTRVAIEDATVPVTNITPPNVVKINSNPYN